MTPDQKQIVQETWKQVVPIADQAAEVFYRRLFEIDPTTHPLFADTDMAEQRKKLVQMLAVAFGALDLIDELTPKLEALGRSHTGYGVRDGDYASVGAALLWTLERGLGSEWTPATAAAWTAAYGALSGIMRGAAAKEALLHAVA
jgi:hemoglobin-like flavoprotein